MTHYDRVVEPAGQPIIVNEAPAVRRSNTAWHAEKLIAFTIGLVQGLIIMRVVMLLLAARQGNDIVSLIYAASEPFVAPFRDMFAMDIVSAGQSALDISAIAALIGWTLIQIVAIAGARMFRSPRTA